MSNSLIPFRYRAAAKIEAAIDWTDTASFNALISLGTYYSKPLFSILAPVWRIASPSYRRIHRSR